MKKNIVLAAVCAVLVIAGGLYYFAKDEPLPATPDSQTSAADPASFLSFNGSTYIEQKDGKPAWEISADTIEMDPATKIIYLKGIKGVFYQDKGGKVDLSALTATMDSKTKNITLNDDVKAVSSSDGAVLTAKQALWTANDRRFFGSGGITLTRDDTVITGDTIETDNNMQKYKVKGNAHVVKKGAN